MRRAVSFVLPVLLAATSCVDHEGNAATFCAEVAGVVDPDAEALELTEEAAEETADDVAQAMRTAEDSPRPVRSAARDLSEGYDELASLLGDEEAPAEELEDIKAEVRAAAADVRERCAEL